MRYILLLFLLLSVAYAWAQPWNATVRVIRTRQELAATIAARPEARFVQLRQEIPGIATDLRYATTNNFTHTILYKDPVAMMRRAPAAALKKVQAELAAKGLGLKIYDAYRPFAVTCSLWRYTTDRRYTANPKKGSHHNRGIAADLTLIDLRTGAELDMGTPFDNFTDTAHHSFQYLPEKVLANRRLLKNIMWKYGFNFVPTEWWHYHWRDKSYDVVDLSFAEMAAVMRDNAVR
jgi:D-alanyl-D-alanine dipeptidase